MMKSATRFVLGFFLMVGIGEALAGVDFKSPKDGETVGKKFRVVMMVQGKSVRPAGEDVRDKKSGHHHLLVNMESIPAGAVIPTDAKHLHFGKGQTETDIELPTGEHTLTLQFADGAHLSYGPEYSKSIKVKVK